MHSLLRVCWELIESLLRVYSESAVYHELSISNTELVDRKIPHSTVGQRGIVRKKITQSAKHWSNFYIFLTDCIAFLTSPCSLFLVFVNIFVKHVINHLVCMFALPQSITLMITLNQTLMPCKNLGWIGKINGSYTCWLTLLNISVPTAVTLHTALQYCRAM
jgi:hypothetical protein